MLILGRRANQSIVFPNCGITVRILDVNGRVAKVGIEAPRSVEIMRGELATVASVSKNPEIHTPQNNRRYDSGLERESETEPALLQFAQRLADVKSSLHTFQQLRAAGDETKADTVLAMLLEDLAHLDKDWLESETNETRTFRQDTSSELVSEDAAEYDYLSPKRVPPFYVMIVNSPTNANDFLLPAGSFHGCQICTVNDMTAAQRAIDSNEPFDFIVCNDDSTVLDEHELAKKIRSKGKYDRTRVFVTSDSTNTFQRMIDSKRNGIDGWLSRPLTPQDLWNHIVKSQQLES